MPIDMQDLSRRLFQAANQLWTNTALRPDQYAQPVLALIALRQMEARFEAVHAEIAPKFTGRLKVTPADYQARGAIYLPDAARFSRLLALPGTADLGAELNAAMKAVADANPDLAGALPQGYAALPGEVLRELLRTLAPLQVEGDAYGLIFEYFMGQFAASSMQKGGEYFTPASIVKLIVEVIEPYHGAILDPACGSGGMFVHSADFVRRHRKAPEREISVHGVEKMADTLRLARLNLAVHGLSGDIREANTYYDDPHGMVGRFDYVMANPPFNQSDVDRARLVNEAGEVDARFPFGLPTVNNANYLWIQMFLAALNDRGRAGFVMHNSACDSEDAIRRQLVDAGVVDVILLTTSNLFYTVSLPCSLWFLDKRKRGSPRADEILFIDARGLYRDVDTAQREMTSEQINAVADVVRRFRGEPGARPYSDEPGFCRRVQLPVVREKKYSLNPKLYVEHTHDECPASTKEALVEQVNDGLLLIATKSESIFAEMGRRLPLDRALILAYAASINAARFSGWKRGRQLRELFGEYIGGTWGDAEPNETSTEAVRIIRGTDIPRVTVGELKSCPVRYVKPSQLRSRRLAAR